MDKVWTLLDYYNRGRNRCEVFECESCTRKTSCRENALRELAGGSFRAIFSFEAPIAIMEELRSYQDYDFALVHLFDYPEYKEYFKRSKRLGRKVFIDNSAYELGDSVAREVLVAAAKEFLPDVIAAPDFPSVSKTLSETRLFIEDIRREIRASIEIGGVVRGEDAQEVLYCYDELDKMDLDYICIPFDVNFGTEENAALRRLSLINYLVVNRKIRKKIHLFGCSRIEEFLFYKPFRFIVSCDTSFPVMHALEGVDFRNGIPMFKQQKKVNFTQAVTKEELELVKSNIREFYKCISSGQI